MSNQSYYGYTNSYNGPQQVRQLFIHRLKIVLSVLTLYSSPNTLSNPHMPSSPRTTKARVVTLRPTSTGTTTEHTMQARASMKWHPAPMASVDLEPHSLEVAPPDGLLERAALACSAPLPALPQVPLAPIYSRTS